MSCKYIKNGKTYSSSELVEAFLRETGNLVDSSIYSSNAIENAISSKSDRTAYNNSEFQTINQFVVSEHPEFANLSEFPLLRSNVRKSLRLAPEVIFENRLVKFVELNQENTFPELTNEAKEEYKKADSKSREYLDVFRQNSEFNIEEETLLPILEEFRKTIEIEEATKNFSGNLHTLISLSVNDQSSFEYVLNEIIESEENSLIFGEITERSKKEWANRIRDIIYTIKENVRGNNDDSNILSDIYLVADSKIGIKGKIDLATVNNYGKVDLYEIKVSRKDYTNWDSAKKLTSDWELGLLKQMLGDVVNLDDVRVHVIPIELGELGKPNTLYVGDFQNRSAISQSGLTRNGLINNIAESFIPRKIFTKVDMKRDDRIKSEIGQLLYPDYSVKTERENNSDLESVMNSAKRRFDITGKWSKYNPYEIEGLEGSWITAETEEEFKAKMQIFVKYIKEHQNLNFYIIKDAIAFTLKNQTNIKTSEFQSKLDAKLNRVLHHYLNEDWEVMDAIPQADAMGLVVLKNTKTGVINIFNLTASNLKAMSPVEGFDYGEVEQLKVMYFINEFKNELFPTSAYKLGQIIIFNTINADTDVTPPSIILDKFRSRVIRQGFDEDFIKLNEQNLTLIEDLAIQNLMSAQQSYVGRHKDDLIKIFDLLRADDLDEITKENLIKVRSELLKEFKHLKEKETSPELNFEDQIEVVFALVNAAILAKDGLYLTGDFKSITNNSIGTGNFRTLLNALLGRQSPEYDKQGRRIEGITGGLNWITPDWNISKDLREIVGLASTGNSATGERMVRMNEKLRPYTKKYFQDLEYRLAERLLVGGSQNKFKNLFQVEPKTGRVTSEFRTKDPYSDTVENGMETFERDYLIQVLFVINSYMAGLSENEMTAIDPKNLSEIQKNSKLAKRLEDGSYFRVPLIRNSELSRYKDTLSEKGRILGYWKDEMTDFLDGRELSQFDLTNIDAQRMGFFEMYDVYASQTDDARAKMVERDGVEYYDLNLDTIAHRVAYNKIRKQTFDLILPTIAAYTWTMKLNAFTQGKESNDIKKQMDYIVNQVKLAVFNQPLIGDEEAILAKGMGLARKISSWSILAFKWSSLPKELTLGTIRNYLASATGIMEGITANHVTKAYGKLITIDNKFTDEFNLIDKLNFFYRIHNMDVAAIVNQIKTDRHGVMKGIGRVAFLTSTIGDSWNRSAILLAKMLKDGSYDAHSLDAHGNLRYDPTKDGRFEYYFQERDKHKDKDGNYMPKQGDLKFNTQRRLYLAVVNQLNQEGSVLNQEPMTENDLIHKAYTQKERDSLKAYADLMYGSYDKESQSQILHKLAGITFLQFLQYWPSKMKLWFGRTIDANDSPIGNFEHAYEMKDGKKIYQYWDLITNEDGTVQQEMTSEDTGDPVHIWMGSPQEGLALSILYSANSLLRGNWSELKNNPWRRNRVIYAMGDAVFVLMILGLLGLLYKSLSEEQGRGNLSGELINFMDNVNTRMFREHDLWDSTIGAISPEPIWMNWGLKTMGGVKDIMMGQKSLGNFFAQNFGIFENLRGLY